jgi:hypothetical protein
MTGNVPYYGGRLSPAQAYAVSHPQPPPQTFAQAPPPRAAPPAPAAPGAAAPRRDPLEALDHLLETGVIDQAEYEQLRARVNR